MSVNQRPDLKCPQCGIPLSYITSLAPRHGSIMAMEMTHDVGRCPTCNRSFHIERATGAWTALPFEPQCPICNEEARFTGLDSSLTEPTGDPSGMIYACPFHADQRWTRDRSGDRWVQLPRKDSL